MDQFYAAIWSLFALRLTNASSDDETFRAFRGKAAAGTEQKKMTNIQLGELFDRLKFKHHSVADGFASGAGILLMNTDSAITEKIIEHFVGINVPILTIHDSYIVPFGYEYELQTVMNDAFMAVVGQIKPRFKAVGELPHEVEQLPDVCAPLVSTERYIKSLAEFRLFQNLPSSPSWLSGAEERLHQRSIYDFY